MNLIISALALMPEFSKRAPQAFDSWRSPNQHCRSVVSMAIRKSRPSTRKHLAQEGDCRLGGFFAQAAIAFYCGADGAAGFFRRGLVGIA